MDHPAPLTPEEIERRRRLLEAAQRWRQEREMREIREREEQERQERLAQGHQLNELDGRCNKMITVHRSGLQMCARLEVVT
ncbi:unnamed protein product [Caenorhabditis nigoni]